MQLSYGIDAYIKEANNIYDLVGNCFGVLCDNIANHQLFVSQYLDEGEKNNPNLKDLNLFSENIMRIMIGYKPSEYPDILNAILVCISEMKLRSYLNDKENQLTIIYCILAAIDASATVWKNKWISTLMGPLDRQSKTKYRVYLNLSDTLHSEYVSLINRSRVCPSTFFEQFENFRFIDSSKWKSEIGIPQVKFLPQAYIKSGAQRPLKFKAAILPVSSEKNFEFVPTIGSGFRVDYSGKNQTDAVDIVQKSLEMALKAKSNIIVLPEYVVSPEVYKTVKATLKTYANNNSDINNHLFAVFAGTTWTKEDNNVMIILDCWGEEIGKYYKYSPYTKPSSAETESLLNKHGFSQCEALSEPGKYCDMVAIEKVGLFLPSICRDAIDGEYTANILKMLFPTFVIISAWSPSVASFEKRELEFANKYFTSTVFANACSAINAAHPKIGNGCIISKENTVAGAKVGDICRNKCSLTCGDNACVYMIEYNFEFNAETNTDISVYKL